LSHYSRRARAPIAPSVTERGAHVEFDCAYGDIDRPLTVDDRGNLAVDGVFVQEHGGPVREGEEGNKQPAHGAASGVRTCRDYAIVVAQSVRGSLCAAETFSEAHTVRSLPNTQVIGHRPGTMFQQRNHGRSRPMLG